MESDQMDAVGNHILSVLYVAFSQGLRLVNLASLEDGLENNVTVVTRALEVLGHNQLVRAVTNDSWRIMPNGVRSVETRGLVESGHISRNREMRAAILNQLADLSESTNSLQSMHITELASRAGADVKIAINNVEVLQYYELVVPYLSGDYQITIKGQEAVRGEREQGRRVERYEKVSEMESHLRGVALQSLFAELAQRDGWEQQTGVKSTNEELDVVLSKGSDLLIVECKWEKARTEHKEIDAFASKLRRRAGVRGLFVSMAGFTRGAVDAVLSSAGDRAILLFGEADIKSMIYESRQLDALIDEKFRQLMSRRAVLVDGAPWPNARRRRSKTAMTKD